MAIEKVPCYICGETITLSPRDGRLTQHEQLQTCVSNIAQRLASLVQLVLPDQED